MVRGVTFSCVYTGAPHFWAEHSSLSPCDHWKWDLRTEKGDTEYRVSLAALTEGLMERELWDPVAHFPLHLWREVAPCDLVMKGCEHTAHCQTNCSTVIEILILLSPSISVTADILHTCSYFETERARERDSVGRCALWLPGLWQNVVGGRGTWDIST